MNIKKTHNELLKRFEKNNWNDIQLTMKNGQKIFIKRLVPPFETDWFTVNVNTPTNTVMGTADLMEVATYLCNYENVLAAQKH